MSFIGQNISGSIVSKDSTLNTGNISIETAGNVTSTPGAIVDAVVSEKSTLNAKDIKIKRTVAQSVAGSSASSQPNEEIAFVIGTNRFSIKRSILAQHTPEFEEKHRNDNEVSIENVTAEVFETMLNYFKNPQQVKLAPESAVRLLLLADDFSATQLKTAIFSFINKQHPSIEDTDEFDAVLDLKPKLSKEFLKSKRA